MVEWLSQGWKGGGEIVGRLYGGPNAVLAFQTGRRKNGRGCVRNAISRTLRLLGRWRGGGVVVWWVLGKLCCP